MCGMVHAVNNASHDFLVAINIKNSVPDPPDPPFYLIADPDKDSGSQPVRIHADPNPGQTLPSLKVGFFT
jgi:hypothetical protein